MLKLENEASLRGEGCTIPPQTSQCNIWISHGRVMLHYEWDMLHSYVWHMNLCIVWQSPSVAPSATLGGCQTIKRFICHTYECNMPHLWCNMIILENEASSRGEGCTVPEDQHWEALVAVCCSALQYVLQYVGVCCSAMQYVLQYVLQCVAVEKERERLTLAFICL